MIAVIWKFWAEVKFIIVKFLQTFKYVQICKRYNIYVL